MLDLGAHAATADDAPRPPVLCTTATRGAGVDELATALEAHHHHVCESGAREARRTAAVLAETRARALGVLADRLDEVIATAAGVAALGAVRDRLAPPWVAAHRLVELVDGHDISSPSRNIQ
jgi:LAO/AO transport system kinase